MSIEVKLITAEQFATMPDSVRGELVRGEVVEVPPPGAEHGECVMTFGALLHAHVASRKLGRVLAGDAGFQLRENPDTVRGPDVSFIRADRVPATGLPRGHFPGPPDLAVEVISPTETVTMIEDKIANYLDAGCPLVVILNPARRTATLHRPAQDPHIVRRDEPLDLSPVVEGFSCTLAQLFG